MTSSTENQITNHRNSDEISSPEQKKLKLNEDKLNEHDSLEATNDSSVVQKIGISSSSTKTSPKSKEDSLIIVENNLGSAFFPSLAPLSPSNYKNTEIESESQQEDNISSALDLSKSNSQKHVKDNLNGQLSDNEIKVVLQKSTPKSLNKLDSSMRPGPSNSLKRKMQTNKESPKEVMPRSIMSVGATSLANGIPSLKETIGLFKNAPPQQVNSSSMIPSPVAGPSSASVNSPSFITPPPLWDMIINFPKSIANDFNKFHSAMCLWKNHTIDGCDLPVVKRLNIELIPASVVHVKLLPRFAANVVQNIPDSVLPKLTSYKMTVAEAWMLNFINAALCDFNLGLQIFMNGDDLVEVNRVEKYYWTVKKIHLEHLLIIYSSDLPPGSIFENKNLVGSIIHLKKSLMEEIKKINLKLAEIPIFT